MTYVAEARVKAENAARYTAQIGKHWAHNLTVTEDGDARTITFPRHARGANWPGKAMVSLVPQDGVLICPITASEPDQRDGLKGAVERHVDRFAFREAPLTFDWIDAK